MRASRSGEKPRAVLGVQVPEDDSVHDAEGAQSGGLRAVPVHQRRRGPRRKVTGRGRHRAKGRHLGPRPPPDNQLSDPLEDGLQWYRSVQHGCHCRRRFGDGSTTEQSCSPPARKSPSVGSTRVAATALDLAYQLSSACRGQTLLDQRASDVFVRGAHLVYLSIGVALPLDER